jgi:pantoate--beta-alanine ligase
MSSRNIHLSADDRRHALVLSRSLFSVKEHFEKTDLAIIKQQAEEMINAEEGTSLEYFEIADGQTLQPAKQDSKQIVALVAARVGNTRLIDNVILR